MVSAASLLAVLPDVAAGLAQLRCCLMPGACLLLVETSALLTPLNAWRWLRRHGWAEGNLWLLVWALVRNGRSTLTPMHLTSWSGRVVQQPLLDGLLNAWLLYPAGEASGRVEHVAQQRQ